MASSADEIYFMHDFMFETERDTHIGIMWTTAAGHIGRRVAVGLTLSLTAQSYRMIPSFELVKAVSILLWNSYLSRES